MSEDATPPHRPTYGVRSSRPQLEAIIAVVLPGHRLIHSQQLPRGKSFNNRIYFLDTVSHSDDNQAPHSFVLRLCGHHFDHRKVENEVGWLLKFSELARTVPTPAVVAWSTAGSLIETPDRGFLDIRGHEQAWCKHGWVLQARLPGRVLTIEDLDGPHGDEILEQLAVHFATWRMTDFSSVLGRHASVASNPDARIGNQCLVDAENESAVLPIWRPKHCGISQGRGFVTRDLLLTHRQDTGGASLKTWAEYYEFMLGDKIDHMVTAPELLILRELVADEVLPFRYQIGYLPFLKNASNTLKFTHMDFAPRNILISEDASQPSRVTGLLDFEFSAMLPAPAEFLNSLVNQPDDWPPSHYKTFLSHLRFIEDDNRLTQGVESSRRPSIDIPATETPHKPCEGPETCQCDYHNFQNLSILEEVIANIAPWYIMPNSHTGKDDILQADCEKAAALVLDGIARLTKLLPNREWSSKIS